MSVRAGEQRSIQVDLTSKEQKVASRTPGTRGESLWLLPSGPDQVHDAPMRGDPPLIGARRAQDIDYPRLERSPQAANPPVPRRSKGLAIAIIGYAPVMNSPRSV